MCRGQSTGCVVGEGTYLHLASLWNHCWLQAGPVAVQRALLPACAESSTLHLLPAKLCRPARASQGETKSWLSSWLAPLSEGVPCHIFFSIGLERNGSMKHKWQDCAQTLSNLVGFGEHASLLHFRGKLWRHQTNTHGLHEADEVDTNIQFVQFPMQI